MQCNVHHEGLAWGVSSERPARNAEAMAGKPLPSFHIEFVSLSLPNHYWLLASLLDYLGTKLLVLLP
jgi:hypothetical protein